MTITVTIGELPINATYTAVTGATGGSGTGAKFDVTKTNGVYTTVVETANLGTGYAVGDTITIPGTSLGGSAPANNDIVTVATIATGGKISTFGTVGTGAMGNGTINTVIDVTGTAGIDTYTFGDKSANFTVVNDLTNKAIVVTSALATQVSFKLENHERVVFTDKATAFDLTGHAGDVYALLKAGFGSTIVPNNAPLNTVSFNTFEGLGIKLEDAGQTSAQIAQAIVSSSVFTTVAGGSDFASFVNQVYTNVVGTAPTPAQALPYVTQLATGATTEAALLAAAAHITSFQQTIGLVGIAPATTGVLAGSGIDYIPA
jgi:hypothetical protein